MAKTHDAPAPPEEEKTPPTAVNPESLLPGEDDCFTIRSLEDRTIGLRIKNKKDFTSKRIPLVFSMNTCVVREEHCYTHKVTPIQVKAAIQKYPGYGGQLLIVAGPGIEITPEIRAFNKKAEMSAADRKLRMVSGTRTASRT